MPARVRSPASLAALALSISACACDAPVLGDAGPMDAPTLDAPSDDAARTDVSAGDASIADAPAQDVARVDAPALDAIEPDAVALDAALDPDAGCADCRGLYPIGDALRVCDDLSTDPNVFPAAPELAAGGGAFAVTCVPTTSASAADDTPWRVDLIDGASFARTSVLLGTLVISRPFMPDVRVVFDDGRFVTAAELDCEGSVHLYRGCTAVHAFLPDASDLRGWPPLEESAGGNFARAIAPLGSGLVLVRRSVGASDRAWTLADDGSATELAYLSGDGGRAEPVTIDLQSSADGFVRFAVSDRGLTFTRFDAMGASLASPVVIAPSARVSRPDVRPRIVHDGDTFLVSFSDGGGGIVVRLDAEGAELARATFSLPAGWPHGQSLHVEDGLVYIVHPGASGPALEVSVFDVDLTPLPARSAPFFTSGTLLYPTVAHDPETDTYAIAYRTGTQIELRRFSHRP